MATRKISECINIRINVGNYQHIELVKYAEEEIEYTDATDRKKKEDALRDDLVESLLRSMKAIPERLGKGVESAVEVEERIKKAIPEWMEKNPIPNIANGGKKLEISSAAEQKDKKDKMADLADAESKKDAPSPVVVEEKVAVKGVDDDASQAALFEDTLEKGKSNDAEASEAVEPVVASTSETSGAKEKATNKGSELFDDDDLFA